MISRFASAGKFLFDAFTVSLVLVILGSGSSFPSAFLWLGSSFGMAAAALLAFWKYPYRAGIAVAIAFAGALAAFLSGMPLWIAAALAAVAVYRLHARFAEWDTGSEDDGNTMLFWVLLYSAVLVIDLLSAKDGATEEANALILAAFSFYVLFHLVYRFLIGRTAGTKLWQAGAVGAVVLSISAAAALGVYQAGPAARNFAGAAAGWLLKGILWPFAPLMEKAADYFTGLSRSQEAQETFSKLGPSDAAEELQQTAANYSPSNFPAEQFFAVGAVLIILLLVFYMRRTKPAIQQELPAALSEEIRLPSTRSEEQVEAEAKVCYSEMPLELVRQSYRKFEQEAQSAGFGREPHETVKEWMTRMGWPATASFFHTYEWIRYGSGTVSEGEASPFLEELRKIKEDFSE